MESNETITQTLFLLKCVKSLQIKTKQPTFHTSIINFDLIYCDNITQPWHKTWNISLCIMCIFGFLLHRWRARAILLWHGDLWWRLDSGLELRIHELRFFQ